MPKYFIEDDHKNYTKIEECLLDIKLYLFKIEKKKRYHFLFFFRLFIRSFYYSIYSKCVYYRKNFFKKYIFKIKKRKKIKKLYFNEIFCELYLEIFTRQCC